MSDQSNKTNQQAKENHSNPADGGKPQGDSNSNLVNLSDEEQRLADEYTEDGLDEVPPHLTNNPNRNLDKPDIDKPPYS